MNECRDAFEKYDGTGLPFENKYERATARHAFETSWQVRQQEIDQLNERIDKLVTHNQELTKNWTDWANHGTVMQTQIDQLVAALERIKEYGKAPCKGDYTAAQIAKDALEKYREARDDK